MPGPRKQHFQKPKNIRRTTLRVMGYMMKSKWLLLLVTGLVLISSGAAVIGNYFLRPLINTIADLASSFAEGAPMSELNFTPFIGLIVLTALVYVSGVVASFCYSQIMIRVSHRTLNAIRQDLFNHMEDLPIRYFDTHTHGELMSRFTNDTDTLREMLSNSISQLISSFVTVIGTFAMMVYLSPFLTVFIVMMLIVMLWVVKTIGKRSAKNFKRQQQAVGAVNGYIEEMIEGQKVVKGFCREEKVQEGFDQINNELQSAATTAHMYASIMMPIMGNISYFNYAATAAIGALLYIAGMIPDIGTIAAFLQYTRTFSQPITQISQQFNTLLAALAGAERIFEMIDEPSEPDEGYVTLVHAREENGQLMESAKRTGIWAWKHPHENGTVTYTRLRGDVRFETVTFGYKPEKTVLHDLSLFAKPGQKIAFVGSTGAGKTTITNLINRFYEIQEGKIRYDGINIQKIGKDDLRRSLGMVLQDTHLFTGTIADNIRYGRLDATDEEVHAAARLANADTFIQRLPNGYDTLLTADGTNLSQGQRQLLAIARAAVANPPVLILDEATSSIDTRTEAHIEKAMDQLMEGRTVFVIAHRLSTVRNADAILVLEQGRVIERGNHEELLAARGKYYQLYTGAFELD